MKKILGEADRAWLAGLKVGDKAIVLQECSQPVEAKVASMGKKVINIDAMDGVAIKMRLYMSRATGRELKRDFDCLMVKPTPALLKEARIANAKARIDDLLWGMTTKSLSVYNTIEKMMIWGTEKAKPVKAVDKGREKEEK